MLLPEASVVHDEVVTAETAAAETVVASSSLNIFLLIYLIGAAASLLLCVFWIIQLRRKIRACNEAGTEEAALLESLEKELGISFRTHLLISEEDVSPFSWLDTIVISKKDISDGLRDVLVHELAHVLLHHSADLLFSEIFIVTQWFNPFIYLMRKSLVLTHDYSADQTVSINQVFKTAS